MIETCGRQAPAQSLLTLSTFTSHHSTRHLLSHRCRPRIVLYDIGMKMKGLFGVFARYVSVVFKEVLFTDRCAILSDTVYADQQGGHVMEYVVSLQSL
jgi:hypothetical protein